MEIVEVDEDFKALGSGVPRTSAHDTGKIHLSDVAHFIDHKMKFTKFSQGAMKWDMNLAAEIGFSWEEVLSRALGDRYAARLGEVEVDGIVGSPDGLSANDPYRRSEIINEEYKATWRGVRQTPDENWYWMTQFKSYCYMLGVDTTLVRALHVNGDYKGSGPLYRVHRVQFTDRELRENWELIIRHRDEMLGKGYMDVNDARKGEIV
jgi:hypothetical protein